MELSIIIVNWNTCNLLAQCLASVFDNRPTSSFEVWVVDNASSDGSSLMVQDRFPQVHLIENKENVGFARANNQAIQMSQGRYILLLNSDTIVHPNALEHLVQFIDQRAQVGIVGAQLLNEDGTLQPSWGKFPTVWSELIGKNVREWHPYSTQNGILAYEVDWVGGACLLICRAAIEQVGLLDESFFMYSEEMDWCFRVKKLGWAVCYYPAAQIIHLGGQSSRQANARMKAELYRSKLMFFDKHYDSFEVVLLGWLLQILFLGKAGLGQLLCFFSMNRSNIGKSLYQDSMLLAQMVSQFFKTQRLKF
jgi:hypothetical protein